MLIDFHVHVFPPYVIEKREELCNKDFLFGQLYSNKKAQLATVEDLILAMDVDGVDHAVLLNFTWSDETVCIRTNDYILESISKYPKKLSGFCMIQPWLGNKAYYELERCIKGGIKGVGELRLDVLDHDEWIYSETMENIVNLMVKENILLMLHSSEPVGHQYPGKGSVKPEKLFNFISKYSVLTTICAHLGGGLPFYSFMPELEGLLNNVYFDTAAIPYLYNSKIINFLVNLMDSRKLIFGSDYPLMRPKRVINYLESSHLAEAEMQDILFLTGYKLLYESNKHCDTI